MHQIKLLTLFLFLSVHISNAQSRTWVVDQNHKKASDSKAKGTAQQPFKTISKAATLAKPGDTVLVFGGVYRERVAPERGGENGKPIVYQAAPNEEVIIKGSEVWKNEWQQLEGHSNVYTSKLDKETLKDYNPFTITVARMEGRLTLGQIFCNGERFMQVDSLEDVARFPGTWMLSYDSTEVILHYPTDKNPLSIEKSVIEFTMRDKVFAPHKRGLGYITVEGFIIEHCANQFPNGFYREDGHPQAGALSTRAGHHWVIRGNTIRHAKSLAIDCGYEGRRDLEGNQPLPELNTIGYHLIENNTLSDNGAGGIAGAHQRETVIRNNVIEGNNYMGFTAPETGGIKVHFFYDGLIENNQLRDNHCSGIWLDNVWYGTRVTRNVIVNSTGQGIFVEMGNGPCLVDNNVIAFTKLGDGIYTHDASGVTIAHNLLFGNEHFGVYSRIVTERSASNEAGEKELVGTKNLTILNNIFVDNYRGHICLPLEDGERVKNNKSDYNLFINGAQWQWEGLGFNSFTLGTNDKRIPKEDLAQALDSAFDSHNYADSLRPNLNLWQEQPLLTYDWWVMLTGNDQHSFTPQIHKGDIEVGAIAKGALSFSPHNLYFKVNNTATFTSGYCPPVSGIDKDFYGNRMNAEKVLPGPFQQYGEQQNRMVLKKQEK